MKLFAAVFIAILFSTVCFSQIPTDISLQIIKAEDARRFDKSLEILMMSPNKDVRKRAALAIGRIGDERGIPALIILLNNDSDEIRTMAAFAVGEIESIKGADVILKTLAIANIAGEVRVRAIEAAGKIAAANAKDDKSKLLGEAILDALEFEEARRSKPNTNAILFALTAVLRSKPEEASFVVAKFLNYSDAKIRQNALNTLGRLRTKDKEINAKVLDILLVDDDAICRANACRVLGIAEDVSAISALLETAVGDDDSRVRVSAIRALGNFKDAKETKENKVAGLLIERGETLLKNFKSNKSELLEIATTSGRLLAGIDDEPAVKFLQKLRVVDDYKSAETEIAFAKIAPKLYLSVYNQDKPFKSREKVGSQAQGLGELANSKDETVKVLGKTNLISYFAEFLETVKPAQVAEMNKAVPDILQAISAFKPEKFDELLRENLKTKDETIRATSASLLGELPPSNDNEKALDEALIYSLEFDTKTNDATLAILDALGKQTNAKTSKSLQSALASKDILIRKKAVEVLKTLGVDASDKIGTVTNSIFRQKDYAVDSKGKRKFVSVDVEAIYRRAVSRKNGSVKAVFTTEKGTFTIDLMPEDAPLTVENFIKLARSNYFNGLTVHRVVPNFVMQDGDPRGDGNGGPGYQIRCEVNMLEYDRGAVGMALSGKDTGGSQWFVTHSPQPHLDGGYTVFGKVNETEMKIVDIISRGDKILTVKIIENTSVKITKRKK
jgi:cyclophilin family peptidyl-prolyl cis-trans isomerase/HEAT repeat protein